jgi:hypothetical protein
MTTTVTIDDFMVGNQKTLDHTITGLLGPIAQAKLGIDGVDAATLTITSDPADQGTIFKTGDLQDDGKTYVAEVIFVMSGGADGWTRLYLTPGVTTVAYVDVYPLDGSGPYTAAKLEITPDVGGHYG